MGGFLRKFYKLFIMSLDKRGYRSVVDRFSPKEKTRVRFLVPPQRNKFSKKI